MTVRLRPHHLLCLLTYVGEGYSQAFVANYDAVVTRIASGEAVAVVDGPDDICAPLLNATDPHCLRQSVVERDAKAALAVGERLGVTILAGAELNLNDHLTTLRSAFQAGATRGACTGCGWFKLCSDVATAGFVGARLKPIAPI